MSFKHIIRTRYSETAQDGIIHHSSFVIYLETARIEFFNTMLDCNINDLEKKKIFCPVIDLSLKYLHPLNSLEDITVEVEVESYSKIRFALRYQILQEDAKIAAKGRVAHCFLNESFKPIPIPNDILKKLAKIK